VPFPAVLLVAAAAAGPPDFDRDVAPVLASRCLDCHGPAEHKGDLDLSRKATALAADGPVVPGKPAESVLLRRIDADEMPPKHPLPVAEKKLLRDWIAAGARWGADPIDPIAVTTASRAGRDWWSLRPVRRPQVPDGVNAIDYFVRAKLAERGLTPSPPADPRALVRRLWFDLVGLPPPVEGVEAFARDPSDAAYRAMVDRLLASPHYGERWARHWLDVVRYAESDGFERNNPRPHAWPYRDWVIRALNADMPYDRFARLQIAGDALAPDDPAAVAATGFLVAGVHNTVLGSNAVANATAQQDELEDMLAAVGQTFLGLTVQCARCHDHKFDPVTQADYYRLAAALGGVTHGERTVFAPARRQERERREPDLRRRLAAADTALRDIEAKARRAVAGGGPAVPPLARWTFDANGADESGELPATLRNGAKVASGRLVLGGRGAYAVAAPLAGDLRAKTLEAWVSLGTLDQRGGGVIGVEAGDTFDAIAFGERQPRKWMAGSDYFRRTRDLAAPAETAGAGDLVHVAVSYHPDGRVALYRDGRPYGEGYGTPGVQPFAAGAGRVVFGVRHTTATADALVGSIEEARLYDRALSAEEVAASAKAGPGPRAVPAAEMHTAMTPADRAERDRFVAERKRLRDEIAALPGPEPLFAVVSQKPPATHVLARGSVEQRRSVVNPGGVAAVPGAADFGLPPTATDAERRAKLAAWVARPDNPPFARVIANRLWHHHFGVGIVDTPSDLGFNGGRPSHPELLDWLADELVRGGFSLKHLHRLIVTSATYRQASARRPECVAVDADDRLIWRVSPRRLESEAVRDALLAVSGQLNPAVGGPPFHDVRTYFLNGTTYYEPTDPAGPAFHRRTIYRFCPRGERSPLLETFDCPDPSAQTPRRPTTTTPLQALALWNDRFVLRMAGHLATRADADAGPDAAARVRRAYRLALARDPLPDERPAAEALVREHGTAALARVLFNCNEFVVIP
jgi:cytochrome c553